MNDTLFSFPPQARVGRVVPKSKIYQHARLGTGLRDRLVRQVEQIVWEYKLAPETINIPAHPDVPEIEVFDLTLKSANCDADVLRAIDRAIPLPIVFRLRHGARLRQAAAYKRPSATEGGKWVVEDYLFGSWQADAAATQALPLALDLHRLYELLLRSLLPQAPRPGETLPAQLERQTSLRRLQGECERLQARLDREKQFNRKVELNAQLRELKKGIDRLRT